MTSVLPAPSPTPERTLAQRRYVMCRPTNFAVEYAINPWMHPEEPVDRARAIAQWEALRDTYVALGHRVDEVDPLPGLPDMVFAANGATVVGGRVLAARFRHSQRAAEAPAYVEWFRERGFSIQEPRFVNEGEGDLLVAGDVLLAGTGFRTDPRAHAEAERVLGLPVVPLELVDPRFYHLDTAIVVLDATTVAWWPEAFSPAAQEVIRRRYPDAVVASAADAAVLGLNAVSDGAHVVLPAQATDLAADLAVRGFTPVPVDLSELRKAGGGPKCCTLEVRV